MFDTDETVTQETMGSIIIHPPLKLLEVYLETALKLEDREDATRTEGLSKFVDGFFDQRSIKRQMEMES